MLSWVSAVKPREEAGASHQLPSLTRSDGAERVSDGEGWEEGSDRLGSSLGAEQQTSLLLTITPVPS